MAEPIVEQLRRARLRRGLSQARVAELIGTTQSAIARLESGQADPRLTTVRRYADVVKAHLMLNRIDRSPTLSDTAVTMSESIKGVDADEALRHVIQLLDDLRGKEPSVVEAATRDEPPSTGDKRWDALLAGVAEYCSRHAGIRPPGWSAASSRFLHRFWFVIEDILGRPSSGLATMVAVAPAPEFSARGVYLDRESLVSV